MAPSGIYNTYLINYLHVNSLSCLILVAMELQNLYNLYVGGLSALIITWILLGSVQGTEKHFDSSRENFKQESFHDF